MGSMFGGQITFTVGSRIYLATHFITAGSLLQLPSPCAPDTAVGSSEGGSRTPRTAQLLLTIVPASTNAAGVIDVDQLKSCYELYIRKDDVLHPQFLSTIVFQTSTAIRPRLNSAAMKFLQTLKTNIYDFVEYDINHTKLLPGPHVYQVALGRIAPVFRLYEDVLNTTRVSFCPMWPKWQVFSLAICIPCYYSLT